MLIPNNILREFRVTEKAANLAANFNQYTFEVNPSANRKQIALAIESVFSVTVTRVNTIIKKPKAKNDRTRKGRPGTKSGYKKAVVSLKEGDKIELV